MSAITLTLKEQPSVPLEAESIVPDTLAVLTEEQLRAVPVWHGKEKCRLDEWFTVEGAGGDEVNIHGDLRRVKWLGKGMKSGRLIVHGNVGMHLGAAMKGGSIEVTGDAGDWVGAEMLGGMIRVRGNAGGQVAAAYRGSMAGMKGGTILIGGTGGMEVGMRMKRGIVVFGGKVRDFAGLQMKGGTLVLLGGAEQRTGAWMIRGTIVTLSPLKLLPTFAFSCAYDPTFLRHYAKYLATLGVNLPIDGGTYQRYAGDSAIPGKGEILAWQPSP